MGKKSISLQYYKNFRQFCFNLEPKVKEMFLFTFNKFLYHITMSMERARGRNKLLYKEAAPRSEPYQPYRVLLTGKVFLSYVAPSLKHFSQT